MVVEASGIPYMGWDGTTDTEAEFSHKEVSFNGVGDDSHESFAFTLDANGSEFCKTNRKPYDALVTACLILADYHFNLMGIAQCEQENVEITTDGTYTDWEDGLYQVLSVFSKSRCRIPLPVSKGN